MTIRTVRNFRRLSQIVFFLLFFWLILKTTFEVSFRAASATEIQLQYPVSLVIQLDPLTALSTLLATGSLYAGLLWSLIILIPTIFLGRFFCGWVCPLGSLNQLVSEIPSERISRKGAQKINSNRYHKYQRLKYYILFICLAAALFGSLQVGLLDPLPLLARSIGTFVISSVHAGTLSVLTWLKGLGLPGLATRAQWFYDTLIAWLLPYRQAHFHTVLTIGLFFLIIMAANRIFSRFWCRGVCPLGALLGLFSRYSIFGLQKNEKSCDHCNLCLASCQGADNPDIGSAWRPAECHLCLNCQASCPHESLSFRFFPNQTKSAGSPAPVTGIDVPRRKVLGSLAAGIALVPFFRAGDAFSSNLNAKLIRPPGAGPEDEFLAKCIRCGQCMRVCPNNALHPVFLEAGAEGIWTPILIAKIGYCEPTCTLCGQVCPTGAINRLTLNQKVGGPGIQPNRIGTAFIDRGRCLPWGMATPCIVCEEWCPTTPKSVYLRDEMVRDRQGKGVAVKQPYVDPNLCTGCGACEYACPVSDRSAIYITSAGDSRSPANQILLKRHVGPAPVGRKS